jgi:SAM-dependent methyltransferase
MPDFNVADMRTFWDTRFEKEGFVWGETPSKTAYSALGIFSKNDVKSILVPGSGYGRNTKLFTNTGFKVTGIEISPTAVALATKYDPATTICEASVLDMSCAPGEYDAVYCFNVLHLFYANERKLFIEECTRHLKDNGLAFFVVFSEKERGFGQGKEVEQNTYEARPGRPTHFFTDADLREHFRDFEILESAVMEDPELHPGEGPHTHILRYILARKPADKKLKTN